MEGAFCPASACGPAAQHHNLKEISLSRRRFTSSHGFTVNMFSDSVLDPELSLLLYSRHWTEHDQQCSWHANPVMVHSE